MNQTRLEAFCSRRYAALAVGVLLFAAFNLAFRLEREFVTEWDEARDFLLTSHDLNSSGLTRVRSNTRHRLYRRTEIDDGRLQSAPVWPQE